MPVKINCPTCNASLNMPDSMYGKAVRCPSCRNPFQCPSGPAAAPAPRPTPARAAAGGSPFDFEGGEQAPVAVPYDEGGYAPRRPRYGTGWPAVRGGLLWFHLALICFFIPWLIIFLIQVRTIQMSPDTGRVIFVFLFLLFIASSVFLMLGMLRTRHAPAESSTRFPAMVGIVFSIIGVAAATFMSLFTIIAAFGERNETMRNLSDYFTIATVASELGTGIVLICFIMIAGIDLRARGVTYNAILLTLVLSVCAAVRILATAGPAGGRSPFDRGPPSTFWPVFGFIVDAAGLVWLVVLLFGLGSAIGRAQRRAAG